MLGVSQMLVVKEKNADLDFFWVGTGLNIEIGGLVALAQKEPDHWSQFQGKGTM